MVKIEFDELDKKALEQCVFVVQNGRIHFPQGANYKIERLEEILKQAKKMAKEQKKDTIMCGLVLRFPFNIKKQKGGKKKNGKRNERNRKRKV